MVAARAACGRWRAAWSSSSSLYIYVCGVVDAAALSRCVVVVVVPSLCVRGVRGVRGGGVVVVLSLCRRRRLSLLCRRRRRRRRAGEPGKRLRALF